MLRRLPIPLALLLVVGAIEATTWALLTPALQGPDETSHISRVEALVRDRVLIPAAGATERPSVEVLVAAQDLALGPTIGNLAARPVWLSSDVDRWRERQEALGDRRDDSATASAVAQGAPPIRGTNRNPPLYSAWVAPAYLVAGDAPIVTRVMVMRLWNVPLLLAAIAFAWLIAGELLPGSRLGQLAAAGFVALHPQLAYLTGVVNPDVLLVALASVVMYLCLRVARLGLALGRCGALAATTLAAILSHPRGIALVVPAVLALLLGARRGQAPAKRRWQRLAVGATLAAIVVAAVVALFVVGTGDVSGAAGTGVGKSFDARELISYVWQFYLPGLPGMSEPLGGDYGFRQVFVETFFGTFASLEIQYPDWVYDVLLALSLLALALLVAVLLAHHRAVRRRAAALVVLASFVAVLLAGEHLVAYRSLLLDATDPIIVGRHLLPLVSLLGAGLAALIVTLPRRTGEHATAVLLAAMVGLHMAGLGLTAVRFWL